MRKRTVLILGAGASQHLGYPLGSELIAQICERVHEDIRGTSHFPPESRAHCLKSLYPGIDPHKVGTFVKHLARVVYSSIDEFLERNSDYIDLGKLLIVRCLKCHEDINKLFPPKRSGWYHYLASSILTDDPCEIPNVPLTIVSFNYDRSLEAYLHEVVANRYRMPPDEAWKIVQRLKIIHPHGMLGAYPQIPYKRDDIQGASLSRLAKGIQIIHELGATKARGFCSPQFREVNRALSKADKVLFLGFGFHDDNLRRFEFSFRTVDVKSTCCGLETREMKRLLGRLLDYGIRAQVFKVKSNCNNFFRKVADLD